VAERAAVSKMTVYGYFPDKPALLKATFERNIGSIRLSELIGKADLPASVEALIIFGERLTSFLNRLEIVKSGRLMAVTAPEHSALAAAFFAAGPEAMATTVANFLRSLDRRGLISLDAPDSAAEQLISAWLGMSQLRQSLGIGAADLPATSTPN
jgi:TetR/AcrR family transcriptional repressor of mexJK operon